MYLKAFALCALLLFALPAFADTVTPSPDLAQEVAIDEALGLRAPARLDDGFGLSLTELKRIVAPEQPLASRLPKANAELGFIQTVGFECNQGAFCRYKTDPICGREGFCNLPSNCCMCH